MTESAATPLVTVVLPTHNRASLLGRAIRSVLAQTYTNLELLVVNDASTDNTRSVVESFDDPRIRYIELETNHLAAGARNVAILQARGEFIAFQDDDDLWLIDKLRRQVACFLAAGPDVGLNLCGYICFLGEKTKYFGGDSDFRNVQPDRGWGNKGLIATPSWLVRTTIIKQAGLFDERMCSWDDWELALRMSELCQFSHVNEPLYIQDRVMGGGMFKNEAKFSNDMQIVMARHADKWVRNRRLTAMHYYLIGRVESAYFSASEGRRWLLRSLAIYPWSASSWIAIALTFLGVKINRRFTLLVRRFSSGRRKFPSFT